MISYIRGSLEEKTADSVVLESNGIGYEIFVSPRLMAELPAIGEEVKIYTHMSVKEDGISLFGFANRQELDIFHRLLTVNGVGPKGALAVLSQLKPQELIMAVLTEDVKALSAAPGVGKKTVQRIILELKDKFSTEDAIEMPQAVQLQKEMQAGTPSAQWEAIDAMMALGYSRMEAVKAVSAVATEEMDTEAILKAALKKMITF